MREWWGHAVYNATGRDYKLRPGLTLDRRKTPTFRKVTDSRKNMSTHTVLRYNGISERHVVRKNSLTERQVSFKNIGNIDDFTKPRKNR